MKIIYDSDNNIDRREEEQNSLFQTEDVELKRPKPFLDGKVKSGVAEKNEPQPQPQPQQGQPVYGMPYGQPMPLTPEQLNFIMAQFAAMQQMAPPQGEISPQPGAVQYIPYQPYVPYQPYPVYPTEGQPVVPAADPNAQASGMKVLFQSEDFDRVERSEAPFEEKPIAKQNVKKEYTYEEIEEETVELKKEEKAPKSSFNVDETQMTMFELSAMRKKQGLPEYKRKDQPPENGRPKAKETAKKPGKDEKKKLPTSEIIRRGVLAVSLIAIVVAAGMLLNEYRLSKQNDRLMEELSGIIIEETTTKKPQNNKPDEEKTTERPLTPEEQWAKLKKDYPHINFPAGLQLKYAKLYATNPEFVGYLSAEKVGLNLPIVQTADDSKYLNKNFYLQNTKYGCPFVTHVNNIEPLDMNTVIFGHHMNNGTIFGALDKYKNIDGFKRAPVITFNTLYKDYSWKVIAAIVTNAYEKDDNGYIFRYYFTQLSSTENFSAYLSELSQRSLYDTGIDVLPTDKILTLSTCSHEFTDARFVVVARLVRPGESTEVDTSRATVNSNPRYPQAWYDKKGKTNPYKNAFQWEVS